MKVLVTIAAICVIIAFIYMATCVYRVGNAVSEVNKSFASISTEAPNPLHPDSIGFLQSVTCDSLIISVTDRISKKTTYGSFKPVDTAPESLEGIELLVVRMDNVIAFSITVNDGLKCIEEEGNIYFILKDGSNIKLKNDFEYNCQGRARILFELPSKKLKDLSDKEIIAIRVESGDGYTEDDLNPYNQLLLSKSISCIQEI